MDRVEQLTSNYSLLQHPPLKTSTLEIPKNRYKVGIFTTFLPKIGIKIGIRSGYPKGGIK